MREFVQAGVELIGAPAPEGTAEVIEVLEAALDAAGLDRAVIGLGDADLYRQLLDRARGRGRGARARSSPASPTHDLVGLEAELAEVEGSATSSARPASPSRSCAAAPRCSSRRRELGGAAVERATARLAARPTRRSSSAGVADRVQIDLGLLRDLGYYTGAILEVYDPALGHVLGGGGRYDELMGRFGVDLPAAGFALYLERVHVAQVEEESRRGRAAS